MKKNAMICSFTDTILAIIFVFTIFLPLIGSLLGWDLIDDLGEKRLLAVCPTFLKDPVRTIPDKFEVFYKDRFGFRNGLIQGHNWIRYKLCKGSSLGKVLFGKDDWSFLTKAGIITDFLGQNPLTEHELEFWKEVLEQRQQWLQKRGIRYLFIIAPNKATIYPEMLPDHIQRNRGRSRMDQLMEYLSDHSTVEFIDLREPLWRAKPTGLLYHQKDSHWTDRGAFLVYQEICRKLSEWFPDTQPLRADNFIITKTKGADDLSMMLGLSKELARDSEGWIRKTPSVTSRIQLTIPEGYDRTRSIVPEDLLVMENQKAKHQLLLFHDSFAVRGNLREHLGELFLRSAFTPIEPDARFLELLTEQEHPDIVIHEIVERKLRDLPSF